MLRHTTTTFKDKNVKFFCEYNPTVDEEYNNWIKSLPGVTNFNITNIDETKMKRVIEFLDESFYKKWLSLRKKQPSWVQLKQYETDHNISVSGKNDLVLYSENAGEVVIPRPSI